MSCELSDQELVQLTEEQALELASRSTPEEIAWVLLRLCALAQARKKSVEASTPSAQIPPYEKPSPKKRAKKRGRKNGHKGQRRAAPVAIDEREEHRLTVCPDCGGPVSASRARRTRIVEDIQQAEVVVTEHTIHSHYCSACQKRVEPKVTAALPKSTIGNRALVLSSWLHYGLGQTIAQIVSVFNSLFHFPISPGALSQQWRRLAEILELWYEQIALEARTSAVLNADETGWRVQGQTYWLWCFTSPVATYYAIDPSRGSDVVNRFLNECFEGTLVSDFFSAYNPVIVPGRQMCLGHLVIEMRKVDARNGSPQWQGFRQTLGRLLHDAMRLSRRADREAADFASKRSRIHERLKYLCAPAYHDPDCQRLVKRLWKHRDSLFTFLDDPRVPYDNNRAEREIRPAVIARKNSFHNTSDQGAWTQAVLMSVYRTLRLRGCDPLETIADALATYIETRILPPLPRVRDA